MDRRDGQMVGSGLGSMEAYVQWVLLEQAPRRRYAASKALGKDSNESKVWTDGTRQAWLKRSETSAAQNLTVTDLLLTPNGAGRTWWELAGLRPARGRYQLTEHSLGSTSWPKGLSCSEAEGVVWGVRR